MKQTALKADALVNIDPQFIQELATGVEDPDSIARRYNFTDDEWKELQDNEWLRREVENAIAERNKSGKTFTTKAKVMAEKLIDHVFQKSLDPNVPLKDKVASLVAIAKLGNLEPEKTQKVEAGPGFSITITVPQAKEEVVITKVEEKEEEPEDVILELPINEKEEDVEEIQDAEPRV